MPKEQTIRRTNLLLDNKNAVIYGAGGSIGGPVAREYAREGARVFLAGRTREKLEAVAEDIRSAGGSAEVAALDALDALARRTPSRGGRRRRARPSRGL